MRYAARAVHAIDRYTSPRRTTAGNFERSNVFQSVTDGITEGFYLMGVQGVLIQGSAGAASSLARRYVSDRLLVGALAGSATGAAVAMATSMATGVAPVGLVTTGALLGAYSGLRAAPNANVRDAGVNGLLLSALFIPGPAKAAGGLGAIVGAQFRSEKERILAGAVAGLAFGASLSVAGALPLGPVKAAIVCAVAGGGGAFIGPRTSQFFRNLAEDIGEKGRALTGKPREEGPVEDSASRRWARTLGVVPLSMTKEMVMALMYGDGAWLKGLAGGALDSVIQGTVMYHSKEEKHLPPS